MDVFERIAPVSIDIGICIFVLSSCVHLPYGICFQATAFLLQPCFNGSFPMHPFHHCLIKSKDWFLVDLNLVLDMLEESGSVLKFPNVMQDGKKGIKCVDCVCCFLLEELLLPIYLNGLRKSIVH